MGWRPFFIPVSALSGLEGDTHLQRCTGVVLTHLCGQVKMHGDDVEADTSGKRLIIAVSLVVLWVVGWGAGTLLLTVGDTDMLTAATASIATLSNVGPGLEAVGPFGDYAFFAHWQKLVMSLLMVLGRLEFFALLALVQPQFWRHWLR